MKKTTSQIKMDKKAEAILKILEASELTKSEKRKVRLIKLFKKGKIKRICKELYRFNLNDQTRLFRRTVYNTYAEGAVLSNMADFHLMGITKCKIRNNDWTDFLTSNGNIKEYIKNGIKRGEK